LDKEAKKMGLKKLIKKAKASLTKKFNCWTDDYVESERDKLMADCLVIYLELEDKKEERKSRDML
jgi:hypothetical protein